MLSSEAATPEKLVELALQRQEACFHQRQMCSVPLISQAGPHLYDPARTQDSYALRKIKP